MIIDEDYYASDQGTSQSDCENLCKEEHCCQCASWVNLGGGQTQCRRSRYCDQTQDATGSVYWKKECPQGMYKLNYHYDPR